MLVRAGLVAYRQAGGIHRLRVEQFEFDPLGRHLREMLARLKYLP